MIYLIGILMILGFPVFWFFFAKFTHFSHEKAMAYKNKELSRVDRFKIQFHLAICFDCQNLMDQPKEELSLEDHLVDPNE